jgi:polysaccharide pyruvyl transferase WcaK-like protein
VRPLTVWLEHSAGRWNVGDDALLVSAARRIEKWLGPVRLILSGPGVGALPSGLPPYETAPSLQTELDEAVLQFRDQFATTLATWDLAEFRMDENWLRGDARIYQIVATGLAARVRAAVTLGVPLGSPGLESAVAAMSRCDLLYVVGDNSFNDFYPAGVVGRRWICRIARLCGARVALSSQGLGPLESRWGLGNLSRMLRDVDFVSLRDGRYGQDRIREAAPDFDARVTGDEAFQLAVSREGGDRLLEHAGIRLREPFVAVNFRKTDCLRDTRALAPRLAALLDGIAERSGTLLAFVPMSYGEHWGDDIAYAGEIRSHMRFGASLRIFPLDADVGAVKAAVGQALYTFGTSYHMHVFGLSQNRPAIILYTGRYYRTKSEGLASFYPGAACALNLDVVDDARVLAAAERAEIDTDRRRETLSEANRKIILENDWILQQLARRTGRPAGDSLATDPSEEGSVPGADSPPSKVRSGIEAASSVGSLEVGASAAWTSTEPLTATLSADGEVVRVRFWATGAVLKPHPEALVPLLLLPAMRRGQNAHVVGGVNRRLGKAVPAIQDMLHGWFPETFRKVEVGFAPSEWSGARAGRTACFFTGGLDSFCEVVRRREEIDDLIYVHGFDVPFDDAPRRHDAFQVMRQSASKLGLPLIEIETDLRSFSDRFLTWEEYHGAALAAVALSLQHSHGRVLLASSHVHDDATPWGSHPDVDPLWSTERLEFVNSGRGLTRVEKSALLAGSDAAMSGLRVCHMPPPGTINCGRCEKCLRTAVSLLAVGALERCETLPHEVRPEQLEPLLFQHEFSRLYWLDNLAALRTFGKAPALVAALERAFTRQNASPPASSRP